MADPRPRSDLLERVLSASAALVAVSALAVSVYQTKITREQQKMSAWPYVTQGNTNAGGGYARVVQNVGLGPALIRSFVVDVDGRPMHYWGDVREASDAGDPRFAAPPPAQPSTSATLRRGVVILPGASLDVYRVGPGALASRMQAALGGGRARMRVCYCSLYDDCWTADTRAPEPTPTPACPSDSAREFEAR